MKFKLMLALVALAGLAAALALASPTRAGDGTTGTTSTQATDGHHGKKGDGHGNKNVDQGVDEHGKGGGDHKACRNVELKGAAGSGTVSFTVSRGDHKAGSLAGKQVTVTIPAGASLSVQACQDANGALTLRGLHVGKVATPTTSTTTTTNATAAVPTP